MPFQTSTWLGNQWSNPGDIFTILMIIGGDVVQVAIAQLCGGPIPFFTPVVFSFGWVTYAVQAMLSAAGENRLMPKPEVDCCIINAKSGYLRTNYSWILSRILRDFEYWRHEAVEAVEAKKLKELREEAAAEAKRKNKAPSPVRIGLRVTVWQCNDASGRPQPDWLYYAGFGVAIVQLGIAAIPWGLYGEWLIFLIVGVGTLLAFISGGLPQWHKEKFGVRNTEEKKDVYLTRGNGDHDAMLILGYEGGMDFEALASPYRETKGVPYPSLILATLWILLLLTIAGYHQHTWYIMAAGILGILHNVVVAGSPRYPKAFGIDLEYVETIVDRKVMGTLWKVEKEYPKAGAALIQEFFPGKIWPREEALWAYADRRNEAFKKATKAYERAVEQGLPADRPRIWQNMPPLDRPEGAKDDSDIPASGEYLGALGMPNGQANGQTQQGVGGGSANHIV